MCSPGGFALSSRKGERERYCVGRLRNDENQVLIIFMIIVLYSSPYSDWLSGAFSSVSALASSRIRGNARKYLLEPMLFFVADISFIG